MKRAPSTEKTEVITVRAKTPVALAAVARRKTEALVGEPGCERVLVVYGANAASLYVESHAPTAPRE